MLAELAVILAFVGGIIALLAAISIIYDAALFIRRVWQHRRYYYDRRIL